MQPQSRTDILENLSNLTEASPTDADVSAGDTGRKADTTVPPSAALPWHKALWRHLWAWLERVPVDDPVDRHNAVFMQLFLIYIGCKTLPYKIHLLLFNSTYQMLLPGHAWPGAPPFPLAFSLGADVLMTASAWLGVYLIRKGSFRLSVSQFLGAMILATLIAYGAFGYRIWRADMVAFEVFALAGFMHGRRALWSAYVAFMCIYATGMTTDYFRNLHVMHSAAAYNALPSLMLAYLIVVIILDRTSLALRRSLAESNQHRRRLQLEMARREQAQEQLLHARKMDAVGKLASGIAHDFNNVLGIIQGFATDRHRLDEPGASRSEDALALGAALEGVEMAARRGASISRKLLNFSRHDVAHIETFDVNRSLRELEPLLHQMLPASIRLQMQTGAGVLPIDFDRSQFELALLNLASNARDAMHDGGELSLSAAMDGASWIGITVQDTGTGIPEEVKQRIFEPFYTTKPANSGTGLGLTVIYGLVDRAGGRIEVDSTPGAGTTFRIRLPKARHAIPADDTDVAAQDAVRVLLIDDDDDLRPLLQAALEKGGCSVYAAATGAEAERAVAQATSMPQVLVCDNRLPDIDGLTLLSKLRRDLPDVPAILISAYLDSDGQLAIPRDPLNERLPKPFPPGDLLSRVLAAARRNAVHVAGQDTIST